MLYTCPTVASIDVMRERTAQVKADAFHPPCKASAEELVWAALATTQDGFGLLAESARDPETGAPRHWPWPAASWKSRGARESLIRAASYLIAAADALDHEHATQQKGSI